MIKYYLSRAHGQPSMLDLNSSGSANFGGHMGMATLVGRMEGDNKSEWELKYDKLLQQQARQLCGAEAMYDKLAEIHTRLNASSELRKEIEELLVAIDNIEVPL